MLMTPQSYCQPGPRRWPNYGRGYETQREINTICMEHGCDRGGRYGHLFDPDLPLFFDRDADDAPPEVSLACSHASTRSSELPIELRAHTRSVH